MYNGLMNNCNCQPGVVTSPSYNTASTCETPPTQLHTVVIKDTEGDDSANSPYAPRLGAWQNKIVFYAKNKAVYLYDVNGVYTNLTGTDWGSTIDNLQATLSSLQTTVVANKTAADQAIAALQASYNSLQQDFSEMAADFNGKLNDQNTAIGNLTSQVGNAVADNSALQRDLAAETTARTEAVDMVTQALQAETTERKDADQNLQTAITEATATATAAQAAAEAATTATQKAVVFEVGAGSDVSTVTLTVTTGVLNQETTSDNELALPVASETQAGVMNSSMYSAFQGALTTINAIQGGAVEIADLAADISQADLTTAWKAASGLADLINQAKIYDSTNNKIWTYYANTETWVDQPAGEGSVSVATATNTSLGIVMGSNDPGQIAVEANGRMSLNNYDAIMQRLADAETEIATIQANIGQIPVQLASLAHGAGITLEE